MQPSSPRARFEQCLLDHRSALLRHARRKGLDIDSAEDAVQEAMLIALRRKGWAALGDILPALTAILNHVIVDMYRNIKRTPITIEYTDGISSLELTEEHFVDCLVDADETAQGVAQILHAAEQANLSYKEQHVLLARLRGADTKEIARAMGIEANAVRSYHSSAIKKIRATIGSHLEYE